MRAVAAVTASDRKVRPVARAGCIPYVWQAMDAGLVSHTLELASRGGPVIWALLSFDLKDWIQRPAIPDGGASAAASDRADGE